MFNSNSPHRDLVIVGNKYITDPVPKAKEYLCPYFKTGIRRAFLKYYLATDGDIMHFCEHTGYKCSIRYVKKMKKEFNFVQDLWSKATEEFDFETIAELKKGNFKITNKGIFCKKK